MTPSVAQGRASLFRSCAARKFAYVGSSGAIAALPMEKLQMTARNAQALDAMPSQLLAALERYEVSIEQMLAHWPDTEGYSVASVQLDEVRLYSASLPQTSVAFVSVLITRAELFHCIFKTESVAPERVAECASDHHSAVAVLRRVCTQLLAKKHGPQGPAAGPLERIHAKAHAQRKTA